MKKCFRAALLFVMAAYVTSAVLTACGGGSTSLNPQVSAGTTPQPTIQHSPAASERAPYSLVVIGTFGGPNSSVTLEVSPDTMLSEDGSLAGCADTAVPDPNAAHPSLLGSDGFIRHAFQWRNGVLLDLGAISGNNTACSLFASRNGLVAGASENSAIDPIAGFPELQAVFWKDGQLHVLPTLGGNEGFAGGVNSRGDVVGQSDNTTADPFPFPGIGQQARAVLWENGRIQDLGTLGGPDAFAIFINDRDQVLGVSAVNDIPNPTTGVPTFDGFLWDRGKMTAIPDKVGGTAISPFFLSNHGEVLGSADPPGDPTNPDGSSIGHPFLWVDGVFSDLGTFGGNNGGANWINDSRQIVGEANLTGNTAFHAFVWQGGAKTDIGTVGSDGCSQAYSINNRGQAVGFSAACDFSSVRAFLWTKGGGMVDLNTLIAPNPDFQMIAATNINERGEISGDGFTSDGNLRAFLLIPTAGVSVARAAAVTNSSVAAPRRLTPHEWSIARSQLRYRGRDFRLRINR